MFILFQSNLEKKKYLQVGESTFVFNYREISRSSNMSHRLFIYNEINNDTELLSDEKPINIYYERFHF